MESPYVTLMIARRDSAFKIQPLAFKVEFVRKAM